MGYTTVDLRGKIPGNGHSNINDLERRRKGFVPQKKPARRVMHYSGGEFPGHDMYDQLRAGEISVVEVLRREAEGHMAPGRFDPDFRVNGIQYHVTFWEDTVYILRNPDALLWHCNDGVGSDSYNYTAEAQHIPTNADYKASARTIQTALEYTFDKFEAAGVTSRQFVKGHQEISQTACPGPLMDQFVRPFRDGKIGGQDGSIPAGLFEVARWVFCEQATTPELLPEKCVITYAEEPFAVFSRSTGEFGDNDITLTEFCEMDPLDLKESFDLIANGVKVGRVEPDGKVSPQPTTSNLDQFFEWLDGALGGRYVAWTGGSFTAGPPAWVSNTLVPEASEVKDKGCFCAAIVTFGYRFQGEKIPDPAFGWPGGMLGYGNFYRDRGLRVQYRPGMKLEPGDIIYHEYTGDALAKQGHIAIVGPGGMVYQSDTGQGINSNRTVEQTAQLMRGIQYVVPRERWFN